MGVVLKTEAPGQSTRVEKTAQPRGMNVPVFGYETGEERTLQANETALMKPSWGRDLVVCLHEKKNLVYSIKDYRGRKERNRYCNLACSSSRRNEENIIKEEKRMDIM